MSRFEFFQIIELADYEQRIGGLELDGILSALELNVNVKAIGWLDLSEGKIFNY